MDRQMTNAGVGIKAILDLEAENNLLVDENDQLKFELYQVKHEKKMISELMVSHIEKLKNDLRIEKERDRDMNMLIVVVGIVITGFMGIVIYG